MQRRKVTDEKTELEKLRAIREDDNEYSTVIKKPVKKKRKEEEPEFPHNEYSK